MVLFKIKYLALFFCLVALDVHAQGAGSIPPGPSDITVDESPKINEEKQEKLLKLERKFLNKIQVLKIFDCKKSKNLTKHFVPLFNVFVAKEFNFILPQSPCPTCGAETQAPPQDHSEAVKCFFKHKDLQKITLELIDDPDFELYMDKIHPDSSPQEIRKFYQMIIRDMNQYGN